MNSPQKRVVPTATAASSIAAPSGKSSNASEFPPIRARSPKKKDAPHSNGTGPTSPSKRQKSNGTNKLPRVSSSVTFANEADRQARLPDSGEELEVLKCILVREGYLQRLAHASAQGKVSGSQLSVTIDVLDLLRISTIEVVEAIVAWRVKLQRQQQPHQSRSQAEAMVFTWNSLNYLLKIGSDLDFLERHQGLVQWLGFTLVRNPFILPVNLDTRAQLEPTRDMPSSMPNRLRRDDSSSQFVQIGGKRNVSDQGSDATAQARAAQAAALAERKRTKNPYETRVINDEELVPLHRTTTRVSSAAAFERPGTSSSSSLVLPSQIGDLDMTRIRACEQTVLAEEAVHGRYTRDIQGLLVPESEAQRRFNMIELSADAYGKHQQTEEGISTMAGPDRTGDSNGNEAQRGEPPLPAKSYAKKRAGMLGPISKPQQRKPVRKSPLDRSRGAHLEETLKQERHANLELGMLIDRVREEIERKEMDLAYFESFPGVQLFGGELDEFRKTTRADVAVLRRDLAEKQYVYASRTANLDRKEEIIHVFKENRKSAVESDRSAKLQSYQEKSLPASRVSSNQETQETASRNKSEAVNDGPKTRASDPSIHAMTKPIVHDMCATLIQKIARGKLARAAFEVLKIDYYVGSKYIQAVIRGFLARRRVAKMYWQLTASLVLQRFVRGLLARRLVGRMRHARERQRAALRIQRVLRGHFGRQRMHRVRRLYCGRQQLLRAADDLQFSDLKELADACAKMAAVPTLSKATQTHRLPSLVLGLVRVAMVYTTDNDSDVDVCGVRWKEAAHFLRCSARLQRRMSTVAGVAATGDRHLRSSLLGAALLEMYGKDADFTEQTFNSLERGWRAATELFRWVTSVATVVKEQDVFADAHSSPRGKPFLFAEATDAIEAMLESAEDQENAIHEHATERRFVPRELVQSTKPRPRAVLLVVAFDVPLGAKRRLVDQLCSTLPGIFVVLNRRSASSSPAETTDVSGSRRRSRLPKQRQQQLDILGADFASVREALTGGHSAILECDVGLTDAQQCQFLGAFTALKAAIKLSPLCILLRGSLRNRPTHEEPNEGSSSPRSTEQQLRQMADADVKNAFERSATWLHRLGSADCVAEMQRVGASSDFTATAITTAYVLVMEAVVILLTPSKHYNAPQSHTSGVSWKLARRLLGNPSFFVSRLQRVEYDSISSDNLRALGAYLRHAHWPDATLTYAASGGLLHALASWVESVVACAEMARDRHGLAPPITRSTPVSGLFDNVVTYENLQSDSVTLPMQELLDATLADVRVYRKVHTLDNRRCVLSVFHDCERVYFSAYDPESSWRWQRVIPQEEIDLLLAPNSIERGEDAALKRQPPATQEEMYDRLVRLCLLQAAPATTKHSDAIATMINRPATSSSSPQSQELIVRPPAIRLFRRVLRLGGQRATVTLAELSRGRIQVDVTVHSQSLALRRVVNLEEILERLSHRESHRVFVAPQRLPALVLERLHLFRVQQASTPTHSPANAPSQTSMKLTVRTKDRAPGRLVLRKAVRSRWLTPIGVEPSVAGVWVFTVVEHHSDDTFAVEVYQPQTSQRFVRVVTKRELQDLGIPSLWQHPSSASAASQVRAIVKLFQFEKDPDDGPDSADARIVSCTLRHHILARFPLAIRFVPTLHHVVEKGGVVRAYVQVETEEIPIQSHTTNASASVRFRICFPERCEEQHFIWKDAEVDSYFVGSGGVTWSTALRHERQRMAHELARHAFQWDPAKRRVVATLPCGSFEASPCTRDGGREPTTSSSLTKQATRSKSSLFASHSSKSLLTPTTPSSCVRLLDFDEKTSDSSEAEEKPRVVFVYDLDELVHTGSYRANGVLVMVQVLMKAVIVTRSEPRLPVDRVEQHDSFELAFDFYHPATSTAQRCVIHGRTELREVVGPERATLIASATLHELMEHIVEARTTVTFNEADGKRCMHAAFVRDRLYAKQKVTPIQQLAHADAASNVSKLIDAKPDRGLKLITKARTIRGETGIGGGKVILTVFDVSHTRRQQRKSEQSQSLQLRVDAYVCDASKLLSLALEAADLVHIVDEATMAALLTTTGEESSDDQQLRRERLASLVADHVGIERRRDGTPDRLFLVETSVTSETTSAVDVKSAVETEQRRLLGKTVRQIRRVPVVLTLFAVTTSDPVGATVRNELEIQCYETQCSAHAQLRLSSATLSGLLGLKEGDFQLEALEGETTKALLSYLLSYVHVDVVVEEKTIKISVGDPEPVSDEPTRTTRGHERYSQWLEHSAASQDGGYTTMQTWRGLAAASSTGHELCGVHVALQSSHAKTRVVCSVFALRKGLVVTRVFEDEQLLELQTTDTRKEASPFTEWLHRIRIHVRQLPPNEDAVVKTRAWELVVELSQ